VERDEVAVLFGPAGTTSECEYNSSLLSGQSKRVGPETHVEGNVVGALARAADPDYAGHVRAVFPNRLAALGDGDVLQSQGGAWPLVRPLPPGAGFG
jgi:hypothetical protein